MIVDFHHHFVPRELVKQDPGKPRPMPVTNHFARTINAVSNQLSSGVPKVTATPLDDSDRNRRGAEFAEKACKAIDKESNFRILTPLLGTHGIFTGAQVEAAIRPHSRYTPPTRLVSA